MSQYYPPFRALVPVPRKPSNPIERAFAKYNGAFTVSMHAIEQMWERVPGLNSQIELPLLRTGSHVMGQWLAKRVLAGSVTKVKHLAQTTYDVLGPESEAVYRVVEASDSLLLITVLDRPKNETRGEDPNIFRGLVDDLQKEVA